MQRVKGIIRNGTSIAFLNKWRFIFKNGDVSMKFAEIALDPCSYIHRLHNEGKRLIGYMDPYFPEEIAYSYGFHPIRLTGKDMDLTETDNVIASFACNFARSILEQALRGDFTPIEGYVFTRYCDSIRGIYEVLRQENYNSWVYYIKYPSIISEDAIEYLLTELRQLCYFLEKKSGRSVSESELINSVMVFNRKRDILKKLNDLRKKKLINMNNKEYISLIISAGLMDPIEFIGEIEKFIQERRLSKPAESKKIPVIISGMMNDSVELFEMLDKYDIDVVSDDLAFGTRYFIGNIEENHEKGCLYSISKRYINKIPCSTKHPTERRHEHLLSEIREAEAKGVIFLLMRFCDNDAMEFPIIKNKLNNEGIPVILLEVDHRLSGKDQIANRIEAFVEGIFSNQGN